MHTFKTLFLIALPLLLGGCCAPDGERRLAAFRARHEEQRELRQMRADYRRDLREAREAFRRRVSEARMELRKSLRDRHHDPRETQ